MTDNFEPIRATRVPLSHAAPATSQSSGAGGAGGAARRRDRFAVAGLVAGVLLLGAVFFVIPAWLEPPAPQATQPMPTEGSPQALREGPRDADAAGTDASAAAASTSTGRATQAVLNEIPPFEQLQREQARAAAQAALSRFVELELRLEQELQVGNWGGEQLAAARTLAATADEDFLRERFPAAVAGYEAAAEQLEALLDEGRTRLEQAVTDGAAALLARNAERAAAAFAAAAAIAPEDPRVTAGAARAALLPEINERLRTARNQELAEDWPAALATLRAVESLDAATSGLAEAIARVTAGAADARLRRLVSAGFAHLDAGRYDEARTAFRDALAIDPGNASAQGGLEQIRREAELSRLDRIRLAAERAVAEERWADAEARYAEALAVDANLQFAIAGRSAARARREATEALDTILAAPDRLSSERQFEAARNTLADAERLDPRGATLDRRIVEVRALLDTYARPVAVLLRSDGRTQVTLSSVGPLGTFDEKQLTLRPGAYTVVGSRDGCRDVREQILVRPDMAPVDIRCVESL
ncbi:MAG: hypothetical protein KF911_15880 [Pseudomonadales bacterium]|nr:hypothetical protein [Pseudomonadales bacterium]